MGNNLIPKSLTREKLIIFKNFTFYDLGLAILYLVIAVLMAVGLVFLAPWYRVIAGMTIFFILFLTLLTNKELITYISNHRVGIINYQKPYYIWFTNRSNGITFS